MPKLEGETFFNNFEQTGYEELKSWTPSYYQRIKEADANLRFAGSTIDIMADSLEKFCENLFAKTMGEEELSRMEKYFYMEQNGNLDIEERRRLLAIALAGSGKISTAKISDLIRTYTGAEASFVFLHRLYIYIHLKEGDRLGSVETLKKELGARMPAHIAYTTDYRTEMSIDERDQERIMLHGMGVKLAFPFWYEKVLSGGWLLDGSQLLDAGIRYGMKPAVCSIFAVKEREGISQPAASVKAAVRPQECLIYSGTVPFKAKTESDTAAASGMHIAVTNKEELAVTVTRYEPGYYLLDGSVTLDGSRNLDSIYEKEED